MTSVCMPDSEVEAGWSPEHLGGSGGPLEGGVWAARAAGWPPEVGNDGEGEGGTEDSDT